MLPPALAATLAAVLLASVAPVASFSTLAVSPAGGVGNSTVVCAVVLPAVVGDATKLNCTTLPAMSVTVYPSADIPYDAIAAGDGFLCGLMAPVGGHASMRWWSFADDRRAPVGERVYWGSGLLSLTAGGVRACAVTGDKTVQCWPAMASLPSDAKFSGVAVGGDFVCALTFPRGAVECFGNDTSVVGAAPSSANASYALIAAGSRHVCAAGVNAQFACWGSGAPVVIAGELPAEIVSMALGDNSTCVLDGDWMVHCWGAAVAVPAEWRRTEFVAITAAGGLVCGVLMGNYSVVCWGGAGDKFNPSNSLLYARAAPGACVDAAQCACGVLPGSGNICGGAGGAAVCNSCKLALTAAKPNPANVTQINSTALPSPPPSGKDNVGLTVAGILGAAVVTVALVGAAFYYTWYRNCDRRLRVTVQLGENELAEIAIPPELERPLVRASIGCEEFELRELSTVTGGFSEECRIGRGMFGSVYRALLPDGREVAIKRAERRGRPGRRREAEERAFRAELALLSRVNHRNLVRLHGFCEDAGERILVFEYVRRGALHEHLHGAKNSPLSPLVASWAARLRVALDAARGVEYLHTYAVPPVIHRDIKPSNILLEDDGTAKVSDFGLCLAAAATAGSSSGYTAGTVGYMDPEYYRLQELTERSDVYSFGVVLLELLTGRRAVTRDADGSGSPRNVVELAVPAVVAGEVTRVLDTRMPLPRTEQEMEAVARVAGVAVECVKQRGRYRPVMSEVVAVLECAVGLCDGAVTAAGSDAAAANRVRSRSDRSESSDPSPYNTSEFGIGWAPPNTDAPPHAPSPP